MRPRLTTLLLLALLLAGPQVYGIAFCRLSYSDTLKSMGFAGASSFPALLSRRARS